MHASQGRQPPAPIPEGTRPHQLGLATSKRTCRPPAPATPVAHALLHCGSTRAHLRSKLL